MITTPHPSYQSSLAPWSRVRDVLAGEDAVKTAGERYLPRVQSHSDTEYAAYQQRASFFNATARTAEGYVGLIFRRPPFIKIPEGKTGLASHLQTFLEDCDLHGSSFSSYAKSITAECVGVGRAGTLIDWDPEGRAFAVTYRAEQILNWRVERINGRRVPTIITLKEWASPFGFHLQNQAANLNPFAVADVEQIRVLKLIPSSHLGSIQGQAASPLSSFTYVVEFYQQAEPEFPGRKPEWKLVDTHIPSRVGQSVPLIPFVFHGPNHGRPDIDKTPLNDIIAVNLDHYRLDADYKHGLHFTALPTAWVSGFDKTSSLKIGSTSAWVTESPGASAGFLEFTGQGLTSFERAMDRDERLMAVLGSRLLENQKRVGETAQAIELRQSGENSVLSKIATSVSQSLTQVLRWAYWWHSTEDSPESITDNQALVRLNTDFSLQGLTSQELQAIVSAWQNKAISRDTMFELFRRGEILPDGRTNDEELRLLAHPGRDAAPPVSEQSLS